MKKLLAKQRKDLSPKTKLFLEVGGCGVLTILIHFVNHFLQLLGCGVLAQHPHHFAQLLGADAAILSTQHKDVKGCLEFCVQWRALRGQSSQGSAARTLESQVSGAICQPAWLPLRPL